MCARASCCKIAIATLITALIEQCSLQTKAAELAGTNSPSGQENNRTTAARPLGPIPVEEARQALTNLNTPNAGQGTWRKMELMDAMDMVQTNVTYRWQGPDGRRLVRSEETLSASVDSKNAKRGLRTSVKLRDDEGSWALYDRVAILLPGQEIDISTNTAAKRDDDDDLLDSPQVVTNMILIGERIKEGDRVLLRVNSTLGEKAQKQLDLLIDQKIKEAKKEVPLLLRPVLAALPLKKMLLKALPVRTEKIIDETTHSLVLERGFNRDGHFVMAEWAWAPWPDLPPGSYEIPKNLKLLRPKTAEEAARLEAKARKEDEKLRTSR